jgi:hypothetical protein
MPAHDDDTAGTAEHNRDVDLGPPTMGDHEDEARREAAFGNVTLDMVPGTKLPNGATVIAASARNAGEWILLAMTTDSEYQPYVTWTCSRPGDGRDTVSGHYTNDIREAVADFLNR